MNKNILLSDKDRKQLRYQCRMGVFIPLMLLVIFNLGIFGFTAMTDYTYHFVEVQALVLLSAILPLLLGFMINRKYLADLKNGEKVAIVKKVQFKQAKKDFEAGSGTLHIGDEMNEFMRYDLIVENCQYRIDKDFYETIEKGDEVVFYYAPRSNYLLDICRK